MNRLLSAADAQKVLGIPAATVRSWAKRVRWTGLKPGGTDKYGRPMYYKNDLERLRRGQKIRNHVGDREVDS